jgi:peptidoglycan hydrolase-like protein with peptidoglycan-binding domain
LASFIKQPKQEGMDMRKALIVTAAVGSTALAAPPAYAQPAGLVYVLPVPTQTVQTVQQRLRQDGDYTGVVDGVWGPDSQAALERYQQRHALQVTGSLNLATTATIGLDPGPIWAQPAAPAPATVSGAMLRPRSVQAIQWRLRGYGYYYGPMDGVWGQGTEAAIERFQQSRGLQVDGQPGPQTVAALGLSPDVIALR